MKVIANHKAVEMAYRNRLTELRKRPVSAEGDAMEAAVRRAVEALADLVSLTAHMPLAEQCVTLDSDQEEWI